MTKYFRWQGILGFIVTCAMVFSLLFFLAPSILKLSIEKAGGWYLGAEVNVNSVELNYLPLLVTINDLQATDNKKPTHNIVAFGSASAGVDVWQYLFGKVLIEELSITGLTFDNERASVGEIFRDSDTSLVSATGQSIEKQMPAIEDQLPDVKDILNDSNLLTVKASKQLEQTYKAEKQKLKQIEKNLPSKDVLKSYEAKVKKLSKTKVKSIEDFNKLKSDFEVLKKQFKQDKALVKKSKQQLKQSKNLLAKALKDVKAAPDSDWQQLKSKYQLDKVDNADFAHILFGEQARDYYESAEQLYTRIKPFLDSNKATKAAEQAEIEKSLSYGRFIHFVDENPLPPWLVKKALFQVELPQGSFNFEVTELTAEHWHRNKPTIIVVSSDDLLKGGDALINTEVFNDNVATTTKGDWQFSQVPINDAKLRDKDNFSLAMQSANLAGVGQFNLVDSSINSINKFQISQSRFTGASTSSVGRSLLSAIDSVKEFSLNIDIEGELSSPKYGIKSDLDNIITKAISQQLKAKLSTFQKKLQAGLNQKVAQSLKISDSEAAEFADADALLNNTDKSLNKLLKSDVVKQKKKELENKAKDKLKDKLDKLFG
ncbi:TIGR03545 family protein [Thalassotalea psychrophila]|uniref:TIGR03545 family protein n=1 Tax=Thalassotalea psychrophila TaxID=3065647 RepID=A0ABY9TRP9_9GAMM|nr:TIGR03545 family protein [Colwelliaceae bacterium SQ149]